MNLSAKFLLIFVLSIGLNNRLSAYAIKTTFGNLSTCDTMTRGPFIIWWDRNYNLAVDAGKMLDSMVKYRDRCLTLYGMQDPPSIRDGYYCNVYIYNTGDAFSAFSSSWGQGVGTDTNQYPFLVIPGAAPDERTLAHETFHFFQYSANSGFVYSGDSQWFIEASANWFGAVHSPGNTARFVEMESLVKLPQVALWLSYDNMPAYYPPNWQRYVHQYALSVFLYYLNIKVGISPYIIAHGFYANINKTPQEYLYNTIGGGAFRYHFLNWAAHMTNDFDFIDAPTRLRGEQEFINYADAWDNKEYVQVYNNTGTGGWYRPADSMVTCAWAYNVYKIKNTQTANYKFELKGDTKGSHGSNAFFRAKVVVQNSDSGAKFYDVYLLDSVNSNRTLTLSFRDTTAYLVIASSPATFSDVQQLFRYSVNISRISSPTDVDDAPDVPTIGRHEVARYNIIGAKVDKYYKGLVIIKYADGHAEKMYIE